MLFSSEFRTTQSHFIYSISMNDKHFLRFYFYLFFFLSAHSSVALSHSFNGFKSQWIVIIHISSFENSVPASHLWLFGFICVILTHILCDFQNCNAAYTWIRIPYNVFFFIFLLLRTKHQWFCAIFEREHIHTIYKNRFRQVCLLVKVCDVRIYVCIYVLIGVRMCSYLCSSF